MQHTSRDRLRGSPARIVVVPKESSATNSPSITSPKPLRSVSVTAMFPDVGEAAALPEVNAPVQPTAISVPGTSGTPASAAYTDEAYAMTKKGLGEMALGAGLVFSVIGGLFGTAVLILAAPALAEVALKFSSFEYFWLVLMGLGCAVFIAIGDPLKGVVSLLGGLLVASVGLDNPAGFPRFTFGNAELAGGLTLIPIMIGMFAVSEIIRGVSRIDEPWEMAQAQIGRSQPEVSRLGRFHGPTPLARPLRARRPEVLRVVPDAGGPQVPVVRRVGPGSPSGGRTRAFGRAGAGRPGGPRWPTRAGARGTRPVQSSGPVGSPSPSVDRAAPPVEPCGNSPAGPSVDPSPTPTCCPFSKSSRPNSPASTPSNRRFGPH